MTSSTWSQTIKPSINKFLPQSVYGKTFLIITVLESSIDIILESVVIVRLNLIHSLTLPLNSVSTTTRSPLAVYLAIFILAHLFQLYFALDALRFKNTIQLIGLCCFNFAFLVYAIIQVPEIREIELAKGIAHNSNSSTPAIILLIIPACIGISQVAFVYLTWHLFKEFGWQIYKQIGADRKIKRVYLWYQIFMCLLKFDYFFFMAFTVQLVLLVPSVSPLERVLTVIALPTTLLLLVVGYYAVRNEIRAVIFSFMVGLLSGSSYFVYKLFRIWEGRLDPNSYQNVFKSLTVFSVSCLLMTLLSFTSAIICWLNFGKGLKVQIDKNSSGNRKKTSERRRRQAEQIYGRDGTSQIVVGDEEGRTGSGTSLGTLKTTTTTQKKGMDQYEEATEQQKLSTFKTNADFQDDDETLTHSDGYFATQIAFDARRVSPPPPLYLHSSSPPPNPLPIAHHSPNDNLAFPPLPSAAVFPRSQFHHLPQRRQNSSHDSHKRMSID